MSDNDPNSRSYKYNQAARQDFDTARLKAFWSEVLSWFSQRQNDLLPFDEVRRQLPVRGQHYAGLKEVPLSQIVGSVSRYLDFDRAFMPRQARTRNRWMNIDRARLQDIDLPPIELYKLGDIYFVKDGNHRVSVARQRGQAFIDAFVIEIDMRTPVTPGTPIDQIILEEERANFNERSPLASVRPEADLRLTLVGQYDRLLEHIDVHRWYLGEQRGSGVSPQEAAASWYDHVYLPLAEIIRRQNILRDFPGRTETDLYLWIIEHYWYQMQSQPEGASLENAARDFAEQFSERRLKRAAKAVQGFFRRVRRLPRKDESTPDGDKKEEDGS